MTSTAEQHTGILLHGQEIGNRSRSSWSFWCLWAVVMRRFLLGWPIARSGNLIAASACDSDRAHGIYELHFVLFELAYISSWTTSFPLLCDTIANHKAHSMTNDMPRSQTCLLANLSWIWVRIDRVNSVSFMLILISFLRSSPNRVGMRIRNLQVEIYKSHRMFDEIWSIAAVYNVLYELRRRYQWQNLGLDEIRWLCSIPGKQLMWSCMLSSALSSHTNQCLAAWWALEIVWKVKLTTEEILDSKLTFTLSSRWAEKPARPL